MLAKVFGTVAKLGAEAAAANYWITAAVAAVGATVGSYAYDTFIADKNGSVDKLTVELKALRTKSDEAIHELTKRLGERVVVPGLSAVGGVEETNRRLERLSAEETALDKKAPRSRRGASTGKAVTAG